LASFAVQVFAPQSANGRGNGANRKGRQERKETPSLFFSKKQLLPFFAFFAVQVFAFAFAVAVHSPFRTSHSAFSVRKCFCKNATYVQVVKDFTAKRTAGTGKRQPGTGVEYGLRR
jgi:hypothetical protein